MGLWFRAQRRPPLTATRCNPDATGNKEGVTACAVTPENLLVELRGVELERYVVSATDDELLILPSSGRGRR
jgi:hypothetical protein